jgi:hypothetical protein
VYFGNKEDKAGVYLNSHLDGKICRDFFEMKDIAIGDTLLSLSTENNIDIPLHTWYHLSFVFKDKSTEIYKNGTSIGFDSSTINTSSLNTTRVINFFGRAVEGYVGDFYLDEIKLFNKVLTKEQIMMDFNSTDFKTSNNAICENK